MRKILSLLLFILFCLPTYSQGFLRRDNKKIVDGTGQEVILRGMGLGGWMLQEGYMMKTASFASTQHALKGKITELVGEAGMNEFYDLWLKNHCTRADIDSLAKWGFNSVRLPMHYNLFTLPIEKEPVAGQNTWLDKGFTMVDSLLKWCTANQMYLILDLHAAPGGQGKDAAISDYDNTKPSLWESAANRAKTVALWKKLAERYANNSWIGGYDLINETNWDLPGGTMLLQLYKEIIAAIRQVDNNHILFIEGNWFANDFTGLLTQPLMDPNMAYSFHKYWNGTGASSIQWMLDIRNNYNVPIWLGESGENSNEWFFRSIKTMEDNKIGWAWWPLKKIGSVVCPATIVETDDYKTLINYWEKGGTKPTSDFSRNALLKIADNAKIQNCTIQKDVIDAMFRQVSQQTNIPFKNHSIPGTISLVDYDLGKVNSAYWDLESMNDKETSTEWNKGYVYRNDGVDIEKCTDTENSNGFNIGWTERNEWMKYTVNVSYSGYYDVLFRVAGNGGLFHVEVNGQDVTGTVVAPSTGGFQTWQSVTVKDIRLEKGTDTLTFKIDQGGFNASSMTWSGPTTTTSAPLRLLSAYTSEDGTKVYLNFNEPIKSGISLSSNDFLFSKGTIVNIGTIEQNSADNKQIIMNVTGSILYTDILSLSYSGAAIVTSDGRALPAFSSKPVVNSMLASQFIPGKVEAENFTINSGFSAEDCTDTGGGKNVGYTDNGDYLEYVVYVRTAGRYNVQVRYSTPDDNTKAEFSLYDNGVKTVLGTVDFTATGGWQNWNSKTISFNLSAGLHRLRYTVNAARFNTNYFNFVNISTSSQQLEEGKTFEVYPNPTKGIVNIQSSLSGKCNVEVVDMYGKVSYSKTIENSGELISIDLSDKPKGFYFLNLKSESSSLTKKILLN